MCLSPYKMYGYFRLPESLFLYILAGYNVFRTPLLLLPMHSEFLFYVYFLLSLSFGFIEIAPETRSIRTHYKCTGIWLEFANSWECKGAGTFRNYQKCMCKLQNLPINGDVNRPENSATIGNTCENSGNFQCMGTSIIRKIPQYRNLPRILGELSDYTGWNNFRLIDSLVLRHPIMCTEFNGRPCYSA